MGGVLICYARRDREWPVSEVGSVTASGMVPNRGLGEARDEGAIPGGLLFEGSDVTVPPGDLVAPHSSHSMGSPEF
ncbi:hypothetical protein Pyn_05763 [Prunus yedoensis var. nudiflora]|uniref:Uncharacterized protein n=1 Tax=Prunus yedoensis var. nudiflora TaxID=2094558 RepID=A0A315A5M8_PRUYE|nr:hypothetical protein Pyn_05763 [Prunus yedoensis var. nudiflora]